MIYNEMRIPESGIFPWETVKTSEGRFSRVHICPITALSSRNYWDGLGEAFVPSWYKFPDCTTTREEFLPAGIVDTKICAKTRMISYGEKMGWVKVERREVWREFKTAHEYQCFSDDLYFKRRFPLFDVTLLKHPVWYNNLLCNEV
jgi:hypothetical protein